jgi:hypothetical protein
MDAKNIFYSEAAYDRLVQWLRTTGEPQDVERVVQQYLDILRELALEERQ